MVFIVDSNLQQNELQQLSRERDPVLLGTFLMLLPTL